MGGLGEVLPGTEDGAVSEEALRKQFDEIVEDRITALRIPSLAAVAFRLFFLCLRLSFGDCRASKVKSVNAIRIETVHTKKKDS
jgi:hypothetical protein